MKFDRVIANPPFSLKNWGIEKAQEDKFERYNFGLPPNKDGTMAFIQHMISSLNDSGIMAVIVSHGLLFRKGTEIDIRKKILECDLLEAWNDNDTYIASGILNNVMVASGFAVAYVRYSKKYLQSEKKAKNLKKGMWEGEFDRPEDWRRK